jgi:hypothetical protein
MCDWKCYIRRPTTGKSSWAVVLYSKRDGKRQQVTLSTCHSMENAEAIKIRVLVLLETVPALEIKAVLDMEKNNAQNAWMVYSTMETGQPTAQFRVHMQSRQVEGIRKYLHVGYYESKTEADNVKVRVVQLLETLDPYAARAQIQVLECRSRKYIRPDNTIPSKHDAQRDSAFSLPFLTSDNKNDVDMRIMVLDRITLFKAYYEEYLLNGRPPVFWVPSRQIENTKLAVLPNGLPALTTKDRSAHSQVRKSGETVTRMICIMDEAAEMLRLGTTIRQRCVCVLFLHSLVS